MFEAVDGALAVYAQALDGGVEKFLVGRPSDVVYRQFNKPPVDAGECSVA